MASDLVTNGNLMGPDSVDPRLGHDDNSEEHIVNPELFDSRINERPLEVYMYYAAIEREHEDNDPRPIPDAPWSVFFKRITGNGDKVVLPTDPNQKLAYYQKAGSFTDGDETVSPTPVRADAEKQFKRDQQADATVTAPAGDYPYANVPGVSETAYRLMRVASWQIVFYLITTDILGFSSAPYAFQQLGYGPGVLVYTFFFILAFCGGQVLWRLYLKLDSEKYPVTCYADLGERTYGKIVRHCFNILQSLQLIFNVGILIIGCGTKLATIIEYKFCYIALCVFWALFGMIGGQIKSFRSFAWFTNVNVFLNIVLMIIMMVGSAIYDPIPSQSGHTTLGPIEHSGWVPDYTSGWYMQVQGVQQIVFAYGGAMIFTEFMAEMRRPRDFWKAAFAGQMFCYIMYMFFGLFVYAYQGNYTAILPSLNFNNKAMKLACNIIGLVSTAVATVLYANVGVKVIYHNVLRAYFKAPELYTRKGTFIWTFLVIGYWAVAWVLGSAVPNIASLSTLIGAACILQFTYTFPPILLLGHWMQADACAGDNPWQPGVEEYSNRIDSWRDMSRWKRGIKKHWYAKVFLFLLFLSSLALCGLGCYAGIESAIEAYREKNTTAFSCRAPGQPK